jgi:hypothetical protein
MVVTITAPTPTGLPTAHTVTTTIIPMPALLTATTGLTGSTMACSSVPARGSVADTAAASTDATTTVAAGTPIAVVKGSEVATQQDAGVKASVAAMPPDAVVTLTASAATQAVADSVVGQRAASAAAQAVADSVEAAEAASTVEVVVVEAAVVAVVVAGKPVDRYQG